MTLQPRYDGLSVVLLEGIELSTSPLPRECSTTELQQPFDWREPRNRLCNLAQPPFSPFPSTHGLVGVTSE